MIGEMKEQVSVDFFNTNLGKIALFVIPFLIVGLYFFLLYLSVPDKSIFWVVGTGSVAYFIPPAGKETVIPLTIGALRSQFNLSAPAVITLVSGTIAFMDIITAYFLLWNFYIAESIPLLGKWINKFEEYGAKKMKEKTWISKIAFVGVALFVFFPFQGSGGVGASILGKVIGMNKYQAWFSIITGAFVGCFTLGIISFYLSGAVLDVFKSSIFKGIGVLAILMIIGLFLYKFSKQYLYGSEKEENHGIGR